MSAATPKRYACTINISAELTLREGLLHKINTGLSGLETNIAFQLMRSRPLPETGVVAPAGAGAEVSASAAATAPLGLVLGRGPATVVPAGISASTQLVGASVNPGGASNLHFPAAIGTDQNQSWIADGAARNSFGGGFGGAAATSSAAAAAAAAPFLTMQRQHSLQQQMQQQQQHRHLQQQVQSSARYPVFSGDDPEGRPAGLGDRFAGRSLVKHVASYLRRRRWLWSFLGDRSDVRSTASAAASGGTVGGWTDGSGSGGLRDSVGVGVTREKWKPAVQDMMNALAGSRRADGFVMVELRSNEALMVKGIRIMLGVIPDEADESAEVAAGRGNNGRDDDEAAKKGGSRGRGRVDPRPMRMLLQYRVFEVREEQRVGQ